MSRYMEIEVTQNNLETQHKQYVYKYEAMKIHDRMSIMYQSELEQLRFGQRKQFLVLHGTVVSRKRDHGWSTLQVCQRGGCGRSFDCFRI